MSQDLSELLHILRFELNYLEQGGYEQDRKLLGTDSPFLGSVACINYGDQLRAHACRECLLHQFVPDEKQNEDFPCHHIQLNASGDTVASMLATHEPKRMTATLEGWLRATIARLEATEKQYDDQS